MTKGGKGPSICGNQNDVGRVRKIKRKQIYQMCLFTDLTDALAAEQQVDTK